MKKYNKKCGLSHKEWHLDKVVDKIRISSSLDAIQLLHKEKRKSYLKGVLLGMIIMFFHPFILTLIIKLWLTTT